MTQQAQPREITLADIKDDIFRAGLWIVAGLILGAGLALGFIAAATPYYKAQMLVAPATPMAEINSSISLGPQDRLSGLKDLIQTGGDTGSADFLRFEHMLKGPTVAAKLLQDEKVRRGLALDKDFELSEPKTEWKPEELADYLQQRVQLQPVGATALRRMVYLHPSREFGIYLLHSLHRIVDDMIRSKTRDDAASRAQYLQQASDATGNPDHRRALTAMLMEEERLLMLTSIDQPYAAVIIEPPSAGTRSVWPDPLMIMPVLMFAGGLSGFLLHGFFVRRHKRVLEEEFSIEEKGWFRPQGSNVNEPLPARPARRLKDHDAAE